MGRVCPTGAGGGWIFGGIATRPGGGWAESVLLVVQLVTGGGAIIKEGRVCAGPAYLPNMQISIHLDSLDS